MPALCVSLACDYTYVNPTGIITGQSVSGTTVTVDGTSLPTNNVSNVISGTDCIVTSISDTQLVCELQDPWTAGSWTIQMRDENGLVPEDTTVSPNVVPLEITGVNPMNLEPAGGQLVTITGNNFPSSLNSEHQITITFSDGQPCVVESITTTEIKCRTQQFNTSGGSTPLNLDVNVNGDSLTTGITIDPVGPAVSTLDPPTVSPIAVKLIKITFNAAYDSASIDSDSFEVAMVPKNPDLTRPNGSLARPLRVVAKDSATNSITVKYGGAYSGEYSITIKNSVSAIFCDQTLTALFLVEDVQPRTGSQWGGTLITITGKHFSDVKTDNPVKIGYEFTSGTDHYCYVESTSEFEIKCRMAVDFKRGVGK